MLHQRFRPVHHHWRYEEGIASDVESAPLPCLRLHFLESHSSSFSLSRSLCRVLPRVHAVVGPRHPPAISRHLRDVCAALDVPHLSPYPDYARSPSSGHFGLNVYPPPSQLHAAIAAFLAQVRT